MFSAENLNFKMISEESYDWSNDAKNSALKWQEYIKLKIYSNRQQLFK